MSDNPGPTVAIRATGATLSVLVRMAAVAEKVGLRQDLVRALAPFVADVLQNADFQPEDWQEPAKEGRQTNDRSVSNEQIREK